MTTNSTISDLERRVARALAKFDWSVENPVFDDWFNRPEIQEAYLERARDALQAHAEWLESRMEKMCAAANDAHLADPEEAKDIWDTMTAAAQQEDQSHD